MVAYEMLTTSAAARRAKCSEATIRTWLRSGQLDHQQTPLGALIDANDLDRLIAERAARRRERVPTRRVHGVLRD